MQELDNKFVELYKEVGQAQGMSDSLLLNLFARLYIEPEPIAMEDLAKDTGYSLASICNTVKMLGSFAPIKKIRKPGSKKVYLFVEKDILNLFKQHLQNKQIALSVVKQKVPLIIKEYKIKAKSECEKKKLKIVEDYFRQITLCETIINEMAEKFNKII